MNKLWSAKTQLTYSYYSLPFCKPDTIIEEKENLGQVRAEERAWCAGQARAAREEGEPLQQAGLVLALLCAPRPPSAAQSCCLARHPLRLLVRPPLRRFSWATAS